MKKRLQVVMTDEAWEMVERVTAQANEGFDVGSIGYSDVINEMVLSSKIDLKALQLKHTNFRRSLRVLASKGDIDLDSAIRSLMDLKAKTARRSPRSQAPEEATNE